MLAAPSRLLAWAFDAVAVQPGPSLRLELGELLKPGRSGGRRNKTARNIFRLNGLQECIRPEEARARVEAARAERWRRTCGGLCDCETDSHNQTLSLVTFSGPRMGFLRIAP